MSKMKSIAFMSLVTAAAMSTAYHYSDSLQYRSEPSAHGRGTVFYDRWRSQDGYNMIVYWPNWGQANCTIFDMNGVWQSEIPGNHCALLPSGGAVTSDNGLTKFDKNLNILWNKLDLNIHHDLGFSQETGEIFAWTRGEARINGVLVTTDELLGFSSDGTEVFRWSPENHLEELNALHGRILTPQYNPGEDYKTHMKLTHFNSVQVLSPNPLAEKNPAFKPGNLLVSAASCICAAIIDRSTKHFVWTYKFPQFKNDEAHSARMLPNGNILIFHNNGSDAQIAEGKLYSRVVEVNPLTNEIVWKYQAQTNGAFFAQYTGASFPLANGNIIVTHKANGGGAFEITKAGQVVWEWHNSVESPVFVGEVYRIDRISRELGDKIIAAKKVNTP